MTQLGHEVNSSNKNMVVLKAKKSLLELLLSKIVEYIKVVDSLEAGNIITEIYK